MLTIGVPATVRNLQADTVVGPVTAAFVESIRGSDARGPSRVQGLTDRRQLGRFVFKTLMPLLEREYDLDPRPDRRLVAGHSLGGLAALHVATAQPDLFGSAILGSAALWWPGDETQLSGAEVAAAAVAHPPARVWMELGTEEGRELIAANRRLRDEATAAGTEVEYREIRGGHDLALWRGGIADALVHLWG